MLSYKISTNSDINKILKKVISWINENDWEINYRQINWSYQWNIKINWILLRFDLTKILFSIQILDKPFYLTENSIYKKIDDIIVDNLWY